MDLKGRKALVIGGAGFIGSHVVDELVREDVAEITVFDNFARGLRENLEPALADRRVKVFDRGGDILHTDILDEAVREADCVFHLAALWLLHWLQAEPHARRRDLTTHRSRTHETPADGQSGIGGQLSRASRGSP